MISMSLQAPTPAGLWTWPRPPSNGQHRERGLEDLEADLARIEQFLDQIHLRGMEEPDAQRLLHLLHSLDHLQRLHERCEEEPERANTVRQSGTLQQERHDLLATLEQLEPLVEMPQWGEVARLSQAIGRSLHRRVSWHLGRISGHLEAAALTKASGAPPCPTMSPR